MIVVSVGFGAAIGGVAGLIGGAIGGHARDGLVAGALCGGVVSFLFSRLPRSGFEPRLVIESFSPAGLVGGIVGAIAADAGIVGGIVGAVVGWIAGLMLPAGIMAVATESEDATEEELPTTKGPLNKQGSQETERTIPSHREVMMTRLRAVGYRFEGDWAISPSGERTYVASGFDLDDLMGKVIQEDRRQA